MLSVWFVGSAQAAAAMVAFCEDSPIGASEASPDFVCESEAPLPPTNGGWDSGFELPAPWEAPVGGFFAAESIRTLSLCTVDVPGLRLVFFRNATHVLRLRARCQEETYTLKC
jgi:hypothetical protein